MIVRAPSFVLPLTFFLASACSSEPKLQAGQSALTEAQCMYFAPKGKVVICHATSSRKKPYVILRVSDDGCIEGHVDHAGDYVATESDPTCNGNGCLPSDAPCEAGASLGCCDGLVCSDGTCIPDIDQSAWLVDIGNGITINSLYEHGSSGQLKGGVRFTAPSEDRMGACLLHKVYVNDEPVACAAASECAQYVPTGGAWTGGYYYCQAAYQSDTKHCYVKQASAQACVGSPANAGQPISGGTYFTDWHTVTDYPYSGNVGGVRGYTFMVQACYRGCATTPPSNSIDTTYVPSLGRWIYPEAP
jgi:hypothetical protein